MPKGGNFMDKVKNSTTKEPLTITIKEIQSELGVSRRVATAWATQYLHYKVIGRHYFFSRKEFIDLIEEQRDVEYPISY